MAKNPGGLGEFLSVHAGRRADFKIEPKKLQFFWLKLRHHKDMNSKIDVAPHTQKLLENK
jgi:hypothetical protein